MDTAFMLCNFHLGLRALGGDVFVVSVDEVEVKRLPFRVEQ